MGYSMHTPCRTAGDRDRMDQFLLTHYRPFSEVAAGSGCLWTDATAEQREDLTWAHSDELRGPLTSDISYVGENVAWYVGFDFGCSGDGQGRWMKEFLRWVATKVGHRAHFPGLKGKAPYIVYDSAIDPDPLFEHTWPVLERSEFPDIPPIYEQFLVDRGVGSWGGEVWDNLTAMKAPRENQLRRLMDELLVATRADLFIHREIAMLDDLWAQWLE